MPRRSKTTESITTCSSKPGSGQRWAWLLTCTLLLTFVLSPWAQAHPVVGELFSHRQPDGTRVQVRIWGDEFYRVVESLDGYTLILDPKTRAACYACLSPDGNELASTGVPVAPALPAGLDLRPHIRINPASARAKITAARARHAKGEAEVLAGLGLRTGGRLAPPSSGNVQGICLIVDFSDDTWTIPASSIDNYCNQVGYTGYGNNGSVRDYFYDVSDGNLTYTNFVPNAYYRAQNPKTYYEDPAIPHGTRARELITEALTDLDNQGFDFSQYDANTDGLIDGINCFYAGYCNNAWAEGLWPHSWTVSFTADGVSTYRYQITDIGDSLELGTFCHENGHMICYWPDLYDYGYESAGVGQFCLMCFGAFANDPVEPCAYFKYISGWSTTTLLTSPQSGLIAPLTSNTSYKYEHPTAANEYYMIENRQQSGRDSGLPDAGLAIWHVDSQGSNNNEQMTPELHYLVTLVQADGNWDLENNNNSGDSTDLWAAPTYTECNHFTNPNTRWWDGTGSGLWVRDISTSSASMTFTFDLLFDCNDNGVPDGDDISLGTSLDCNTDGVPDECQTAVSFASQSPRLSPIGTGSPQSHVFTSPPPPLADVSLNFEAIGDFSSSSEWVDVDINGTPVGTVFVSGEDCPALPNADSLIVPQATFVSAVGGGNAVVNMVATSAVNPSACSPRFIRVALKYQAAGVSCNSNGIPDDCDIAAGTSYDCNTNGVPDECDVSGSGLLLDADFDAGLPGGWTVEGTFQITDQCGAASPDCGGTYWAYAGSTGSCSYGDNEFRELIAPTVTLGHGLAELRFCSRIETEADWDFGRVLVNGTTVWEQSGGTGAWGVQVVDLSAFAGQTVVIIFQFTTDTNTSGWLGWQVDNVLLTSGTPDCDTNGTPDECDPDCNTNGSPDACDIAAGTSFDVNTNGVPDECDECVYNSDCDDSDPCTDDICDPQAGCVHPFNTSGCDDGDPCTESDSCSSGVCAGTPKDCDDASFCNGVEYCETGTGDCLSPGDPCGGETWCDETADECVAYGDGRFDGDADCDLADFRAFQECFGIVASPECRPGNMTGDGLIDLDDYALFEAELSTSGPQ